MRTRFTVLGFVLATASLAVVVPATAATTVTTATAATTGTIRSTVTTAPEVSAAPSNCPAGALCGYTGANYTGSEGKLFGDNPDLNVSGDVWNNVDSIYNNGNSDNAVVYRDENYTGVHLACLYRGTGFPNMQSRLPDLYHHIWSNFWITIPCT
jgi:hypothetical protein